MSSAGEAVTAEELLNRYLVEKTPAWAKTTAERERARLEEFLSFVVEKNGSLDHSTLAAFVNEGTKRLTRYGRPLSVVTVQHLLEAVRRWLRWAYFRGYLLQDLGSLVVPPRFSPLPRAISESDMKQLLDAGPHTARERAIVELLYGTGLRANEAARLEVDDVDPGQKLLRVRLGKGRKDRVVPFGEKVRRALIDYMREERPAKGGPVFRDLRGYPLTPSRLSQIVAEVARRAGLTRRVSAHRLRHSYATHLLRNGASVRAVQMLLGHSSLVSTQVYLGTDVSDLAGMLERCHPRGGGNP